jgi:hypothetical protein
VLRHVVLFAWKDGTPPETVRDIENAFRALPGKIPEVQSLEWGTDVSVEGLAEGLTHCFLVTFANAADRDVYLPHPDHAAFGALIRPHLERVLVFDYHPQD